MLNDNGVLYIHDLKRVLLLYYIKSNSGFFNSIRAAYRPDEIKAILKKPGIESYKIKTILPFFMQSILIKKSTSVYVYNGKIAGHLQGKSHRNKENKNTI